MRRGVGRDRRSSGGGSRRVALVAGELLGVSHNGGLGTSTTHLALALAHAGHEVEIHTIDRARAAEVDPGWSRIYDRAGVRIIPVTESRGDVRPAGARTGYAVRDALQADPPDVVVGQDWGGPTYQAVMLRALGLRFERTRFVTYCHGPHRWVAEANGETDAMLVAMEAQLRERVVVEQADAVVSPSAYLLDWMTARGWAPPPTTRVIPHFTWSSSTGTKREVRAPEAERFSRFAFFGRLEERKGVRVLLDALALVDPSLLADLELVFLGRETREWTSRDLRHAVRSAGIGLGALRIETALDEKAAQAELRRPGTLAVMPSLTDNSPNTVYECLELGVPFIASNAGGGSELIAARDRDRATCPPTSSGLAEALERVLRARPRPVASAVDDEAVRHAWQSLVLAPPERGRGTQPPPSSQQVAVVVRAARGAQEAHACLSALEHTVSAAGPAVDVTSILVDTSPATDRGSAGREAREGQPRVLRLPGASAAASRRAALDASDRPWLVFLEHEDVVDEAFLPTLVAAQQATNADVVTCAVRCGLPPNRTTWVFDGDPAGLGLLGNRYGTVALVRRTLLEQHADMILDDQGADDLDWCIHASLACGGAAFVTVPVPLATTPARPPGDLRRSRRDALRVTLAFESAVRGAASTLPTIAAALHVGTSAGRRTPTLVERARIVHDLDGVGGVLRWGTSRAAARVPFLRGRRS